MKLFCDEFCDDFGDFLSYRGDLKIEIDGREVAIRGVSYFDGYDTEEVSIFDEKFSELTEGKWGHFSGEYFYISIKKNAVLSIRLTNGEEIRFEEGKNGLPTIHKIGQSSYLICDQEFNYYRISKNIKYCLSA